MVCNCTVTAHSSPVIQETRSTFQNVLLVIYRVIVMGLVWKEFSMTWSAYPAQYLHTLHFSIVRIIWAMYTCNSVFWSLNICSAVPLLESGCNKHSRCQKKVHTVTMDTLLWHKHIFMLPAQLLHFSQMIHVLPVGCIDMTCHVEPKYKESRRSSICVLRCGLHSSLTSERG